MTSPAHLDAVGSALVAELARRGGVCWVRGDGGTQTVWHVWDEDALAVVSGGGEQPFPAVTDGGRVEVTMRSRDSGGRLLTWVGRVRVVAPDDERWPTTTGALLAARLNLVDPGTAVAGWARDSIVRRVEPTGELVEAAFHPHASALAGPASPS